MQHWRKFLPWKEWHDRHAVLTSSFFQTDVYRKWNQNLFEELYVAYMTGRMEKSPATFWYKGEFGFFDFYIIPLTQKLKDCGVFGVSSDELLNYAKKNRIEWEEKGEEVVAEMLEICQRKYGTKDQPPEMAPASLGQVDC